MIIDGGSTGAVTISADANGATFSRPVSSPTITGSQQIDATTEWGQRIKFANAIITHRPTYLSQRALGTMAAPSTVTLGTIIGGIEAGAFNGSAYTLGYNGGAGMLFQADGTWTTSSMPSSISFYTTAVNATGYSERMRISPAGFVTAPSQPSFHATRAIGASPVSLGTDSTVLPFDTVFHNIGGYYNTSTYRFTAPIAGRYLFCSTVRYDSAAAGSYMRLLLSVNGGTETFRYAHSISGSSHSTDYESLSISVVINLNAGDYVQVLGGRNGGSSTFQFESQFSGILIG